MGRRRFSASVLSFEICVCYENDASEPRRGLVLSPLLVLLRRSGRVPTTLSCGFPYEAERIGKSERGVLEIAMIVRAVCQRPRLVWSFSSFIAPASRTPRSSGYCMLVIGHCLFLFLDY